MTAAPLATLVDDYLHVLSAERGASTHTLRAYRRELHDFIEWLAGEAATLNVQAVEHTHIRSYLGTLYHRGLSKASAARALASIRSWFKWLARTGYVEQNVASLVATPRLPKAGAALWAPSRAGPNQMTAGRSCCCAFMSSPNCRSARRNVSDCSDGLSDTRMPRWPPVPSTRKLSA